MGQLPFRFREHVQKKETPRRAPKPPKAAPPPPAPHPATAEPPPARETRIARRPAPEKPQVWSVSKLQRHLRGELEGQYPDIYVGGEISNFSLHGRSGHAYFTLKDRNAALSAVMWADQLGRLKFRPQDGMEVIARGNLTVWAKGGRLQLSVNHLEPVGLGALEQEFRQRVEQLRAEGLTATERKRPIPEYPARIGVVTSPEGAALRDVLKTLWRRDPQAHIVLAPTPVQGRSAAFHIAQSIRRFEHAHDVEVVLLVRGGGSLEDLWAFNEEVVARAVAACRVPIISGVGHETDTTIVDLIADLRASTPTAAAEHAGTPRKETVGGLQKLEARLHRAADLRLQTWGRRLAALENRIPDPRAMLRERAQDLDDAATRAERAVTGMLRGWQARLQVLERRLNHVRPDLEVSRHRQQLESLQHRLHRAAQLGHQQRTERLVRAHHRLLKGLGPDDVLRRKEQLAGLERGLDRLILGHLKSKRDGLTAAAQRLEALSPLGVLARGYSLVRTEDGRVVRKAQDVQPGDRLDIQLHRSRLRVRVEDSGPG